MTIIYNIEVTAQFADENGKADIAEKSVLNAELKSAWEHKVERAFEQFVKDANIVCTDIKVFPTV